MDDAEAVDGAPAYPPFDAIVLAGGAARRLGGVDKPGLVVGGRSLLEHVVAAVREAADITVVGTRATAEDAPGRAWPRGVHCFSEDPPGGGPLAALAAGLPFGVAPTVLVAAADLPWLAPAVAPLRAALAGGPDAARADVACLTDSNGRRNHLAALWRRPALQDAVRAVADRGGLAGAPVRRLVERCAVVEVPDAEGWGQDCDTWPDVAAARARAAAQPGRAPRSSGRAGDVGRMQS